MKYGLTDLEFQFLRDQVIDPLKKAHAKVYLFGSRANGHFKRFSDVDILYISKAGDSVPLTVISGINFVIEESHFPYRVDLVDYAELASSYRLNIETEKVEL